MAVTVEFVLFLKPEEEFSEKDVADPVKFRRRVVDLCNYLNSIVDVSEKLHKAGWNVYRGMYEVCFIPNEDYTPAEAKKRLRQLGIDPSLANIHEIEEEDEDFDEDVEQVVRAGGER
jgi:hypothetical protein